MPVPGLHYHSRLALPYDFKRLRTESEHYLIAKSELTNSQQIRNFEFPKFMV